MERPPPARQVAAWPCQSSCRWAANGEVWCGQDDEAKSGADLRVFACSACGSEWIRTEAWTPVDARGQVPEAVRTERARGPSCA